MKYSNPIHLDEVAADFPDMQVVMAHPSVPWQDEALSIAVHKPNVWIDLSGWSPKYFPPQLVRYANSLLKEKVLFGTDFPALTPERWLRDFDTLQIKDEVRPLILKDNARAAARARRGLRRRRRPGHVAARQITISPSPTVRSAFSTRSSRWTASLNAASARPLSSSGAGSTTSPPQRTLSQTIRPWSASFGRTAS